jgi:hypothetical protein
MSHPPSIPARRLMASWRARFRSAHGICWIGVLPAMVGSAVHGQAVSRVDSTAACGTCRLELGPVVALRGPFEDESLANAGMILRAGRGRVLIVYEGDRHNIEVFMPDGSLSGTRIGRRGTGPGEFQAITYIGMAHEFVYAFDGALRRRTDFDLANDSVLRIVSLPVHFESLVLETGTSVLSGAVATRAAAGYPLHVHDAAGGWLRSFGIEEPVLRPDLQFRLQRWLAPATDSSF